VRRPFDLKVFEFRCDSLLQLFAQGAEGAPACTARAIAHARPKPWTFEPDLAEDCSYDNRSTILVVEWSAAAATVVLRTKVACRLAGDEDRLGCGQQLTSLFQGKAQLLEIFVRPLDDRHFDGFAWRTTVPVLQARFDDYSHGVASLMNEMPVKPSHPIVDDECFNKPFLPRFGPLS
jgi:hypothetical protein